MTVAWTDEESLASVDPFTQVYRRLFEGIFTHGTVSTMVRTGNRISLIGTDPMPIKANVQEGDLPELSLLPGANGQANLFATSSSHAIRQPYVLRVASDDLTVGRVLFPLKWAIIKALSQLGPSLGGLSFVRNVTVSDFIDTLDQVDLNRGAKGWSASATIMVEMWFTKQEVETWN